MQDNTKDLWLFGYGSIIWKADFPYSERARAHVRHWSRRFWQGSEDHRGVPEAPGRVVTLTPRQDSICEGLAYRLHGDRLDEVISLLDHREKGGYERIELPIHIGGETVTGITYCAEEGNPNFLGAAPLDEMARQIAGSHGPSGSNKTYILNLDQALLELDIVDAHVQEVALAVRLLAESS